jgi:iron complex outermembrane recepter protein
MKPMVRAALLAATVMSPASAWAQANPNPVPSASEDDQQTGGIQDIVVTARKTAETLSDAPVSVSAVTSETIEQQGLRSIDEIAKQATGISFSQAFGRSTDRPVIRGQSNVLAGVQFGVETGAAYFVDGIYYQGDIQGFDPGSIERVEVIKGPQSALYGRNTYSGAINFITKDPTSEFSGSGTLRVAEYGEIDGIASISGPIIGDKLGFRAGGRYYKYDGQYRNQLTGNKVGQEETTSAYLTIVAKPTDDLRIRLRGQYQKDDDGPLALFLTGAENNNCKPGFRSLAFRGQNAPPPSPLVFQPSLYGVSDNNNQYFCGPIKAAPNKVRLNTDPVQTFFGVRDGTAFDGVENEQYLASSIIDWNIGGSGWTVSSMTGYRENTNRFGTDSDHSEAYFFLFPPVPAAPAEGAFANTTTKDTWDFSQEVRIATPTTGPVSGFIGAYYFKQEIEGVDLTFANPINGEPLGSNNSSVATVENKAVFGLVTWDITPTISITGEVRYQEEYKTLIDRTTPTSQFCAGASAENRTLFGFTGNCLARGKWTGTDPRVTINWQPNDNLLIYAIYAQGRKPGGFNGTGGLSAFALTGEDLTQYQQETAKGGEYGVKYTDPSRKFSFTGSVFYNKLEAVQLTRSIPPSAAGQTTTSVAVNSGDAETKGFEFEGRFSPIRELNIFAGFTYTDARFTRGCDFDFFVLNSGGLQPNFSTSNPTAAGLPFCNIKGKQLPLASKYIVNGSINYEPELSPNVNLVSNLNFSFESKKYVQTDNLVYVPDAFLMNARLGVRFGDFSLVGFVRNLTDEDAPPLATRWFDYRYGNGVRNLPAPVNGVRLGSFAGQPAVIDTAAPRAFFTALRKGRTFGVEGAFRF